MTTRSYSPLASVAIARRKLTFKGEATLRPLRGRQSAGDCRKETVSFRNLRNIGRQV